MIHETLAAITGEGRFADTRALLDWGFDCYTPRRIAAAGAPLMTAPGGAPLIAAADLTLRLRSGEEPRLVYGPGLSSELTGGAAGTVRVYLNGKLVSELPVTW